MPCETNYSAQGKYWPLERILKRILKLTLKLALKLALEPHGTLAILVWMN